MIATLQLIRTPRPRTGCAPLTQCSANESPPPTDTPPQKANARLSVPKPLGPYVQFVIVPTACLPNITQPVELEIPIRHAELCCGFPIKWLRYVAWCVLKLEGSIWISRGSSTADRSDQRCDDRDMLIQDVYYQFKPNTSCKETFARATVSS